MSRTFSLHFHQTTAAIIIPAVMFSVIPLALSQVTQADIATPTQEVTVVINGQNPGSGVLIGKQGNTYTVLTANHVVASPDEYQIVTADGKQYPLNYTTVRRLPNLDLALVEFTSDQQYAIAQMGDSHIAQPGTSVYIAGWPHPGIAITERIFQMTPGQISGRSPSETESGYELIYTNITRSGMSGGPVLDTLGRLIGIHGRAEGQAIYNPDTGDTVDIKSGFNLGIPLDTFIESIEAMDSTVLSTNPSFAYPLSKQGDRLLAANQIQPAIAQYQRVLALDPNYLPAVLGMGQGQYEAGDSSGAIAQFQKAINLATEAISQVQSNPNSSPQEQLLLVQLNEVLGNAQVALASALYASGEQETALSLVFELLKSPENWQGRVTLLQPNFTGSRLQADAQAVAAAGQQIVTQGVDYLPTKFNLAQALYERGQVQEAIPYLETLFQENPQDAPGKIALAAALNATGNREQANRLVSELQSEYGGQFRDENFEFLLMGLWSSRLREDVTEILAYYRPSGTRATSPEFSNSTLLHSAEDSDRAYIEFLSLSRDGKILVSTNGEGTINVWDIEKGTIRHTFSWTGNIRDAIALSPDGRLLAAGIWDDTDNTPKIQLWDTDTGEAVQTLTHPGSDGISAVAFSPNSQTLASSGKNIILWNANTGQVLNTLAGNSPYSSYSLAFSPDGEMIASSSVELIQLWNSSSGEEVNRIELLGEHIVNGLIFSSQGNLLLSQTDSGIQFWNPSNGSAVTRIPQGQKYALSPDGQTLALCAGSEISLVNVASTQVVRTLLAPSSCYQLVFLPDGKTLVSGGDGGKIELWDLNTPTTRNPTLTLPNAQGRGPQGIVS
ncbi:trypsin-like peptidase domain-containing protein [Laspinema olomoucense]|uniref:trypsin-like peptidase domain-containing protein n=1 Tax=Laspinema olomoucense TaxID=3231600 RepID=UPI0021BBA1A1|nr:MULTISPECIES: trypsin-like peptidase domain-containing protein [unclassified Laspinema]MCT7972896.1 trypsin-like peptidase domain-containing protein [Laspinema sp. D3d]MCT7996455.1 trypsin-like peptidase domain-containing protein [Laspinema sp. D3c]